VQQMKAKQFEFFPADTLEIHKRSNGEDK